MYSLDKCGVTLENYGALRKFLGPPLEQSFRQYCGFSVEKARAAVEYYREYFRKKGIFENTVYDGVEDTLAELQFFGKN